MNKKTVIKNISRVRKFTGRPRKKIPLREAVSEQSLGAGGIAYELAELGNEHFGRNVDATRAAAAAVVAESGCGALVAFEVDADMNKIVEAACLISQYLSGIGGKLEYTLLEKVVDLGLSEADLYISNLRKKETK